MEETASTGSASSPSTSWLDRPVFSFLPGLSWETFLVIVILVLAVVSRFTLLGARVMSHDETNHVVPSFDLYQGRGYVHNPVTHGPFQFHVIALTYFLFGATDFTSRLPAALFGIAAIAFVLFAYRRYLGRIGALVAGFLFLISPYMLFYSRYTRNEAFIMLIGVVLLYAVLRYLEDGKPKWLYLLTGMLVFHFIVKETAYIYTALLLVFLAILFLRALWRWSWPSSRERDAAIGLLVVALVALVAGVGIGVLFSPKVPTDQTAGAVFSPSLAAGNPTLTQLVSIALAVLGLLLLVAAALRLVRGMTWDGLRSLRSFNLLFLTVTLVLPLLAGLPEKLIGFNPLDYSSQGMFQSGIFIVLLFVVAFALGMAWDFSLWLKNVALFYAVFIVFYTTFFTNGGGFFTGLLGALGYWLAQQAVDRGGQPLYYYLGVQIPIYEYLSAIGTLFAAYFALRYHRLWSQPSPHPGRDLDVPFRSEIDVATSLDPHAGIDALWQEAEPGSVTGQVSSASQPGAEGEDGEESLPDSAPPPIWRGLPATQGETGLPIAALLLYWALGTLVVFSLAGEKMPWLTVHIALPMILAAGWGFGAFLERAPWKKLAGLESWLALPLWIVLLVAIFEALSGLLGSQPPFRGSSLDQLQATGRFLFAALAIVLSAWGIGRLWRDWRGQERAYFGGVTLLSILAVLTARTAYTASFINYDNAKEFLVYAHASSAPKQVLAQVEDISRRVTGGEQIKVAYDSDALYPFWWYLRDFPNRYYFSTPDQSLRDYPLIIVGQTSAGKMEPIVRQDYVRFDYIRLWWPMQDYFNLTPQRIWDALKSPDMRTALFDIWLNRDYGLYAQLTNNPNLTLETWQPSSPLQFYVRKDIVAQIWQYGTPPGALPATSGDPYAAKTLQLAPDKVLGADLGLNAPSGLALAPDGSLYVADTGNSRVLHLSADGKLLSSWGQFADVAQGHAPGGTFNQPSGIAVGPDGSVYVADTWNHRIQKFTADGKFVAMWGTPGQGTTIDSFYGPRGVAVDAKGRVFVTDTGNKRVVFFDANGGPLGQFGSAGSGPGQMDEPVGIGVDSQGRVYVADTWNQRVEVFAPDATGLGFTFQFSWPISAWYGQSLNNKPYLALGPQGMVFVTDPEGLRVIEFDAQGQFQRAWESSGGESAFSLPSGLAVDAAGGAWVSDAGSNRVLHFTLR